MKTDTIQIVGNLIERVRQWKNPQRGIVYSTNGVIGCLNGLDFRANQPKIIEVYETENLSDREILQDIRSVTPLL